MKIAALIAASLLALPALAQHQPPQGMDPNQFKPLPEEPGVPAT